MIKFLKALGLSFCIIITVVIFNIMITKCYADDYHVIDLNEVSITAIKLMPGGYDPLITQNGLENKTVGDQISLNVNTTILNYGYWDNLVHTSTDRDLLPNGEVGYGQYRVVGWEFHIGANITENIRLGYFHHSQHLLDTTYKDGHFPVVDGIELKIWLFKPKQRTEGLF